MSEILGTKWRKVWYLLLHVFSLQLPKFTFWKGDWSLGYVSTQIWDYSNIYLFPKVLLLNPIQEGGRGAKSPPPSLLPVFPMQLLKTYELAPKRFWLLVLILLSHSCKISGPYLMPVPYYWTSTNSTPQKN